jgi:hypothetical protein
MGVFLEKRSAGEEPKHDGEDQQRDRGDARHAELRPFHPPFRSHSPRFYRAESVR